MSLDTVQQYLFDLQGYLVIENALSTDEVATINAILDEHQLPEEGSRERFGSAPDGPGFLDWGQPFCNLLDHETIMPILRQQLGDCFRLDRIYGICMEEDTGRVLTSALHADYGATAPFSGVEEGEYFAFKSNQIYNGFVVVTWNLTDSGPGMGGFSCIPGSHKSNYKVPRAIFDSPETSPTVVMPHAPAGSVTLFTESLTHGTAVWRSKTGRRSLLYKYCVSHMAWKSSRVQIPDNVKLTDRQEILFGEPGDPYRYFPSLFA